MNINPQSLSVVSYSPPQTAVTDSARDNRTQNDVQRDSRSRQQTVEYVFQGEVVQPVDIGESDQISSPDRENVAASNRFAIGTYDQYERLPQQVQQNNQGRLLDLFI